mgnify:CR=1 FL=1
MIEKRYLYKRHNVYWVRVRVPNNLRSIIGKTELNKNLYTTNLSEANIRKHKVVAELKQIINLAKRKIDGTIDSLSKEDQLREVAMEFRPSPEEDFKTLEKIDYAFQATLENKIQELYGQKELDAIFNSHEPEWKGKEPNPKAMKATSDAFRIFDPNSEPLSVTSKTFLSEKKKDLKTATFKRKEGNINNFVRWTGNSEIKEITKRNAGDYVTHLRESKNPAPATLRNTIFDISSLFTWAEGRGYIDKNPFQKLNLPSSSTSTKKREPWDYEQLMMFLKSKYTGRNEFIATVIAMYSGMRLGEICDLKNKDIYNGCFHVKEGKTPSAARVIPIHPVIKPIIENLKNTSENEYLIRGISNGGYDSKRSWNFQKKLTRLRQKLKTPEGLKFHTLRNTFATRMENLGIPTNHLNKLLGHKNNNMSLDVYSAGLAIEPLVESINKLTYGEELDSFVEGYLKEKSNGEANDKITDMELLAKLQTSESILGSRILRNVREGD